MSQRPFALMLLPFLLISCGESSDSSGDNYEAIYANMDIPDFNNSGAETQNNQAEEPVFDNSSNAITSDEGLEIIKAAGHQCEAVIGVIHNDDSTIAECSDGERYRLLKMLKPVQQNLALKCSAMAELGVEGGC